MHLHWKKHETVKVVCKPGQVHEYAEELAQRSKGIVIDIKPDNMVIFYHGKNDVQPKGMSPPDALSKAEVIYLLVDQVLRVYLRQKNNIQQSFHFFSV